MHTDGPMMRFGRSPRGEWWGAVAATVALALAVVVFVALMVAALVGWV
jgi:hypothetical protein